MWNKAQDIIVVRNIETACGRILETVAFCILYFVFCNLFFLYFVFCILYFVFCIICRPIKIVSYMSQTY